MSEIIVENFRQFPDGEKALKLNFNEGLTAIVGENDSGKSALVDAMRFALQTKDQEFVRLKEDDFYIDAAGNHATEIRIRCKFSKLTPSEKGAFAEYLTYEGADAVLFFNWLARRLDETQSSRRWIDISHSSGIDGTGPQFEPTARALLWTTYLKPLRDAEKEMSPGKGSRLSQVLAKVPEIKQGNIYNPATKPANENDLRQLNLVGLSEYYRELVAGHAGIQLAETVVNRTYLSNIILEGDNLLGKVSIPETGTDETKMRQILERLDLSLLDSTTGKRKGCYGLGSNNLLFIACELLLLGQETEGLPLLLIEEPEAHLHPQRQLRLMQFLEQAAKGEIRKEERPVQVILTTHSPNLSSAIPLDNIVMLQGCRGFSLAEGQTRLDKGDYRFLERFLDVTKANLFFARGLLIVEGDAEALLLPTLAKLLNKDLTKHGVSIVNVGGVGLGRYAKIFQRRNDAELTLKIPVACVTDLDIMPDCAPEILELVTGDDDQKWNSTTKKWKCKKELGATDAEKQAALQERKNRLSANDAQKVRTFVSDHWTLEYDLAISGLAKEVYIAAFLAKNDDPLNEEKKSIPAVVREAHNNFKDIKAQHGEDNEKICSEIYKLFKQGASKTVAAQYLAEILLRQNDKGKLTPDSLETLLPQYIKDAIAYVTGSMTARPVPTVIEGGTPDAER